MFHRLHRTVTSSAQLNRCPQQEHDRRATETKLLATLANLLSMKTQPRPTVVMILAKATQAFGKGARGAAPQAKAPPI